MNPERSRWSWNVLASRLAHLALVYTGALASGLLAQWIRFPLPWMFGAMVFAAGLNLCGRPAVTPVQSRQIGQAIVASSVGLSFTPEAVRAMGGLLLPMVGAALGTIALGFLVAASLMRMVRVDVVTAALASIPMGPVESANLAIRHGVSPGPVIFAQTLRIMLIVTTIPPAIVAIDGRISDPVAVLSTTPWTVQGALLLALAGAGGALLARAVRLANPYFVGALGGAASAAAMSLPITAYPYPFLVMAQVFLGVWLGAVFDRNLLRHARGFIPAAIASSALMIVLCALMGMLLGRLTGEAWNTMILATAPGSVTEMALTAKILQDGLAVVTAFHVVRIFIILPFAGTIIALTQRIAGKA